MRQPKKIIERKPENTRRLIGYLASSFDDYIASRTLFNHNMLVQACCLANTSFEKYFKAFVDLKGNTIKAKHNLEKLLPTLKDFDIELYNNLNIGFLQELTKIYDTRYVGDCPKGYNFAILRNKYLAELDYTYSLIEPKIRYSMKGKEIRDTSYEHYFKTKNPLLWKNNYVLNNISKTKFIESLDYVEELRVYELNGELFEVKYHTEDSKNDGIFNIEGFKPTGNDHKSFKLSHLAYQEKKE